MKNPCLKLFLTFFKIGLFTFGGGYAMIPLMHKEMVEKAKYINDETMADIIAISESTPGPIAINGATFIGYKVSGILGSICATVGVVLPSLIIIFLISLFFNNLFEYEVVKNAFIGIQAAVTILLFNGFLKIFKTTRKNIITIILALGAALITYFTDFSSILLIIIGGIIGLIVYSLLKVGEHKNV
ncbi:MAG: chromate transporter [Bacilli bacterium]|nr:chromate transporter [Bacilli bacterium]